MSTDWLFVGWMVLSPLAAVVGAVLGGPRPRHRVQWAAWGLVFWPAVVVLAVRRARGEPPVPESAMRPPPAPVPAPTDDALAHVPEPVSSCPACGFLGIRAPGVQDGVWPGGGELIDQVCPRCDYRGLPVVFSRREDYARYVRDLAAGSPS